MDNNEAAEHTSLLERKDAEITRLRAAVAAETERCARVDPQGIDCPICDAEAGWGCEPTSRFKGASHSLRWRAAIRKEPE